MEKKEKKLPISSVLFLCLHNSARSQMAEAFLKKLAPDRFQIVSAGLIPGVLNPLVVQAMLEVGIDISTNQTKTAQSLLDAGWHFDHVITVCNSDRAEQCPIFPGFARVDHWDFIDPSDLTGDDTEKLAVIRIIRDGIFDRIQKWLKEMAEGNV